MIAIAVYLILFLVFGRGEYRSRALNLLIALDQFLFCVITFGKSGPDETASAAAWRGEVLNHPLPKFFRPIIDWLFHFIERDHCYKSYQAEQRRSQSPPEV